MRRLSLAALAVPLLWTGAVGVPTPCTSSGIMAVEPGCPNDPLLPCQIRSKIEAPAGEGCVLDFAGRDLIIGSADGPAGSVRAYDDIYIRAKTFTMYPNGSISGRADGAAPQGVNLSAEIAGPVTLARKGPQMATIDVSGAGGGYGGGVDIEAEGIVTIDGLIRAGKQFNAPEDTAAQEVAIHSPLDIVGGGQILNPSGIYSYTGYADVALDAGGKVDFAGTIDISGYATSLYVDAPGGVHLHDIAGAGDGIPSFGGNVDIKSGGDVLLSGDMNLRAIGASNGDESGYGGNLSVVTSGSISITGQVRVGATGVDGSGGSIDLRADTDLLLDVGALLSAAAGNSFSYGGSVTMEAGRDMTLRGDIDVGAHAEAGEVEGLAGRHLVVDGTVDASAPPIDQEASAGQINFEAGTAGSGHLTIHGQMDANSGGCLYGSPDGGTGGIGLTGCNVEIAAPARLRSCGVFGGWIEVTARRQLTISGEVRAPHLGMGGYDGLIQLIYPADLAPQLALATFAPAPTLDSRALCTAEAQPAACLTPCPECGNGLVEYPETCDTAGTPVSCDGCSMYCRAEEPKCDDGLRCTDDSCHPIIACVHDRRGNCYECPGDVDRDGAVDADDINAVIAVITRCDGYYRCPGVKGEPLSADFNHDAHLTASDLTQLLANRIDPSLPNGCAACSLVEGCDQ